MTTPSNNFGGPGGAYGNDPNPSGQGNDPYDRRPRRGGGMNFLNDFLSRDAQSSSFPFMFGIPPKDLIPNYMPQITPMTQGNPQSVEQLYAMYGATPNAPMPVAPNVPPPAAPQPPPAAPPGGTQIPAPDLPFQFALARLLER